LNIWGSNLFASHEEEVAKLGAELRSGSNFALFSLPPLGAMGNGEALLAGRLRVLEIEQEAV
jgi:hypothetical protein